MDLSHSVSGLPSTLHKTRKTWELKRGYVFSSRTTQHREGTQPSRGPQLEADGPISLCILTAFSFLFLGSEASSCLKTIPGTANAGHWERESSGSLQGALNLERTTNSWVGIMFGLFSCLNMSALPHQISRHREAFVELNWFPAVNGDGLSPLCRSSCVQNPALRSHLDDTQC